MSTRATILVHTPGVRTPKGKFRVKLYQHTDGYVEGVGTNLVRGFQHYKGYYSVDRCLKLANYYHQSKFELTDGYHGDTEFMYHIYQSKNGKDITITYQEGFGDREIINNQEFTLFSRNTEYIDNDFVSLKLEIEERELYNIKQRVEAQEDEYVYYADFLFSERFQIHEVKAFKEVVSKCLKDWKDLREDTEKGRGAKQDEEDKYLLAIKEKIPEQREKEKNKYYCGRSF